MTNRGFTGSMGSMDVTHLRCGRATASHAQLFTGRKEFPTLAHEATVNQTGRIVPRTRAYPGLEGEKMIVSLNAAVTIIYQD